MSAFGAATLLSDLLETSLASIQTWVEVVLAEEKALRTYDSQLLCTKLEELEGANRIHAAWKNWLSDAETLWARIHASGIADKVANLDALRDAIGWGGCTVQATPAESLHAHEQVLRGETFSSEEVRRGLRLAHEPPSQT
jgi:hypothetical protein